MANQFEVSVDVGRPPDEVWKIVGNPADIGWFPPVAAAEVREGHRYLAFVDGRNLVERLIDRDDAGRSYSYSVIEGTATPLRSHLATLAVVEAPGGSRIVWRTEAEPEDPSVDLEARLGGVMLQGLEQLKLLLEADDTE
jgi:uncharacterized protein YndB with AHSA1/START domain